VLVAGARVRVLVEVDELLRVDLTLRAERVAVVQNGLVDGLRRWSTVSVDG
jgi:hypothetical protein